jgi:hypothetical protein
MITPRRILRRTFQTEIVAKIKAHFLFSATLFSENHAIFSNVEKYGGAERPQVKI